MSPGPVHRGERLTIAYEYSGPGEAQWFEAFLALRSSDRCEEGPVMYSHVLNGEPWNLNYYIGPWYEGKEVSQTVAPPALPDRFRICLATRDGEEQIWEEFIFVWLP
jgi:hypothetical protein